MMDAVIIPLSKKRGEITKLAFSTCSKPYITKSGWVAERREKVKGRMGNVNIHRERCITQIERERPGGER